MGSHPSTKFFEDWTVGYASHGTERYPMVESRMIDFASEFDPQDFHTDAEKAKDSIFGELIASGWHTGSAMMRLITEFLGEASMGSPGLEELRWMRPVVAGDVLRLVMTPVEKRRSKSKPDRGLITMQQEVFNQADELVMSAKAIMLIKVRSPETPDPD